jgi:hypothetical protein
MVGQNGAQAAAIWRCRQTRMGSARNSATARSSMRSGRLKPTPAKAKRKVTALLNQVPPWYRGRPYGGYPGVAYTERRNEYLKKANEAELNVARTTDPAAKEAWQRIAASYRILAHMPPGKDMKWHA